MPEEKEVFPVDGHREAGTGFPWSYVIKGLLTLGLFAGAFFLMRHTFLGTFLEASWLDRNIRGHGASGIFVFVGICSLLVAVGIPRQMVSFAGGYVYGFFFGFLIAQAGTAIGGAAVFLLSSGLFRKVAITRYRGGIEKAKRFFRENTFSMALIIRLAPVGNNLLTNILAGVGGVPAIPFLAGSFLGYIPQTVIFSLLGSGFKVGETARFAVSAALFVLSAVLGVLVYRKMIAKRRN